MRVFLVIVLSTAAGAALGAGLTWAKYGSATSASAIVVEAIDQTQKNPGANQKSPRAKVDAESFDFGAIEAETSVEHAFKLTNTGTAQLTVTAAGTTCQKCTIAELDRNTLEPGETMDVVVRYQASIGQSKFRQTATLQTNDPLQPRIELTISGEVTSMLRLEPRELVFSKLSVHDTASLEAKLYNFVGDELKVVGHKWSDAGSSELVVVEFVPLDQAALDITQAKSGQKIVVTIKPGLPLGLHRQKLLIDVETPEPKQLELEIMATIASDFSLAGVGWKEDDGYLNIGPVQSKSGTSRKLMLLARGPHRHDAQITVGEVWPEFLKVTVGDKSEINDGAVVQYPLTIEIPPGSPYVNHLGSQLGKLARVVIETTHPDAKQVKIPIRFAVEE